MRTWYETQTFKDENTHIRISNWHLLDRVRFVTKIFYQGLFPFSPMKHRSSSEVEICLLHKTHYASWWLPKILNSGLNVRWPQLAMTLYWSKNARSQNQSVFSWNVDDFPSNLPELVSCSLGFSCWISEPVLRPSRFHYYFGFLFWLQPIACVRICMWYDRSDFLDLFVI